MSQIVEAIYEGGVLKPLAGLHLQENQLVRLTIDVDAAQGGPSPSPSGDPLLGLACDMGFADLAQNFDDYRFGPGQP